MGVLVSIVEEIKDLVKEVFSMVSKIKDRRKAFLSDMNKIKTILNQGSSVALYKYNEKCEKWGVDYHIPRKIRKLLAELIKSIPDYNKWFEESMAIIRAEIKLAFQKNRFKALGDRFVKFKMGDFNTIIDVNIDKAVLNGTTNFTQCKEYILQKYGRDSKTADGTESLREFVDSEGFHDLVELLESLGKRASMEAFRDARGHALKIIDQIEEGFKKKSRKKRGGDNE